MSRDLMHSEEVKAVVRDAYSGIDRSTEAVAEKLYEPHELEQLPRTAIERSLGVANHLRFAEIEPGDEILDLGCGGGIDTVLAAIRTGPEGRVVALDFLPEMLQRTEAAARECGLRNVRTLESEMEAIALPDDSIDLVVSNGVINLSPRKARVFAECSRVLRPGGRLCVSDLTVEHEELPAEILTQPAAWAGCVSGALKEEDFVRQLAKAGFRDVEVLHREALGVEECALYPLFTDDVIGLMRELITRERQHRVAVAVVVRAIHP